mgnify:CR=1 FL=1
MVNFGVTRMDDLQLQFNDTILISPRPVVRAKNATKVKNTIRDWVRDCTNSKSYSLPKGHEGFFNQMYRRGQKAKTNFEDYKMLM